MSYRQSSGDRDRGGGGMDDDMDHDPYNPEDQNNLSDDDNAAPEMQSEGDDVAEKEDPLLLAIDDLEGRVVSSLDDVKLHPGIRSSSAPGSPSVHEELATLLRPVLEVAAHTGPSIARTYYLHSIGGSTAEAVEASCEDVYQRVVSDLVLPVMLEMAQSDTIPAKRGASLEFFKQLFKECHKAGSWLDHTTTGPQCGPYGSGTPGGSAHSSGSHHHHSHHHHHHHHHSQQANTPVMRAQTRRRQMKKLQREGEILRYWIQASIACTTPGVFTNATSEGAVASRGIIAASASLRPCLKHIAQRIKDADDRGANRLYGPMMKMVEGVLKKLFLSNPDVGGGDAAGADSVRSACIKFLEIAVMCCSRKPQDTSSRKRAHTSPSEDFSLDDLPAGHPIITREGLESIAEYAFATLRGIAMMGGQVKIDINLLSETLLATDLNETPSSQVINIIKPAALAYLEMESSADQIVKQKIDAEKEKKESDKNGDNDDNKKDKKKDSDKEKGITLDFPLDRSNNTEYDFLLSQKSYSLTLNAIATLAVNRPVFFKEAAICLARRAVQPPTYHSSDDDDDEHVYNALSKTGVLVIRNHLRATCLTLLRNSLSITSNSWPYLHLALKQLEMEIQADKALSMARQTTALKTAGRAARNRANMYYEWDATTSEEQFQSRISKRQRETDDALAKMRAAKKARGLGHGIQLPTNMSDSVELILMNLTHLPSKRPLTAASSSTAGSGAGASGAGSGAGGPAESGSAGASGARKITMTLDTLVDAIMTNGASLAQEEGRWYDRDGGNAFAIDLDTESNNLQYHLGSKFLNSVILSSVESDNNKASKMENTGIKMESSDDHRNKKRKIKGGSGNEETKRNKQRHLFMHQCDKAASDAIGRIVVNAVQSSSRSDMINRDFGNMIASRLAFTLKKIKPSYQLQPSYIMANESVHNETNDNFNDKNSNKNDNKKKQLKQFVSEFPLVASCLAIDATTSNILDVATADGRQPGIDKVGGVTGGGTGTSSSSTQSETNNSLTTCLLNEAYAQSMFNQQQDNGNNSSNKVAVKSKSTDDSNNHKKPSIYEHSLDVFVASVIHAGKRSNDKPSDADRRRAASQSTSLLQHNWGILPHLTDSSLSLVSAMCDIDDITKKAAEAARKTSQQTIAAAAATHAAKAAAEKRATSALLMLRDAAFQRTNSQSRRSAVDCAVKLASGHYPASTEIEGKALKLVMNVLFAKNDTLAAHVIDAATVALERAADYAIEHNDEIERANAAATAKKEQSGAGGDDEKDDHQAQLAALLLQHTGANKTGAGGLTEAGSDVEREAMEKVKKPAVLFMALCVRRPDIIQKLFEISSRENAVVLCKAVRANMSKLARAAASKHGAAAIALRVADLATPQETPLVLSFLDNLTPATEKNLPGQDMIDVCFQIQEKKAAEDPDGKKDPRFLIPIVSAMKRMELIDKLSEFVQAEDTMFMTALVRMGDRVGRQALLFRDEPDPETPTLRGMTLCEQLVYLHRLDFQAAGVPQKRYLNTIRLCLDNEEIFNDRIIQSALDQMSGTFLTGAEKLPLAYMRTIILVCSKHESLHSWICHILLPRLVEGKIYTDRRQWEGWMRCAKMLENPGDSGAASSIDAIRKLPVEQLQLYRTRYGEPGRG